jgi:hypothetical protein
MEWYLRDYKSRRYYSKDFAPDINLRDWPVIIAMAPNIEPIRDKLGDYIGQKYKLNWWFPEDYKNWRSNPWLIWRGISDPATRSRLVRYILYRDLMNTTGSRDMYFFVRKDVPTVGPAATGGVTGVPPARPAARAPEAPISRNTVIQPLADGARMLAVAANGEGALVDPKGIAFGPDGRMYVTEGRAGRVSVFNPDGSVFASWGRTGNADGEFAEPWGVAVTEQNEVFVADTWNHRIQKLTPDGQFIQAWGGMSDTRGDPNAQPGRFWGPRSIAIGPDGLLYVSDTGNKRVQVFDTNGTFQRAFGGAGDQPGKFNEPVGLAFAGSALVVADAWNSRVQRVDTSGAGIASVAARGWESKAVPNKPYIAADASGQIFYTAPEAGLVVAVDSNGSSRELSRSIDSRGRLGMPTGIAVGPDGSIYVVESTGGVVVSYPGGAR